MTKKKEYLTFKRQPPFTGLMAITELYPTVDIKHNGKVVGEISPPGYIDKEQKWRIMLRVTTEKGFTNRFLKARFDDEKSARAFLKKNATKIIADINLNLIS